MPGASSSEVAWFGRLEPAQPLASLVQRADDPRLGEIIEPWQGDPAALRPGRAVIVGYPQDEGVRRNQGRPGAAEAPDAIRHWLYRLTPWDAESDGDLALQPPLDLGNLRVNGDLEQTQQALAEVLAEVFRCGGMPIVLGGGHETAYAHYLGYVAAGRAVGILNVDAHLDVRPCREGQGHSGSPFRQALEHPTQPLPGERYVCLGAQPHSVSRHHWRYARERGCVVRWRHEMQPGLAKYFEEARDRLASGGCQVYVTLDADAVQASDVPGVSAPNPAGLPGAQVLCCARLAGRSPAVSSLDLVEVNPRFDRDHQSVRWAALVVWNYLIGLSLRPFPKPPPTDGE
jgi:formiminoglutamase